MKGELNPLQTSDSKISTFLRLVGEYIPILESLSDQNSLKFQKFWAIDFLSIKLDFSFYFQLIVGWRVEPGMTTLDRYDVVYTPFAYGETSLKTNGTTLPVQGSTEYTLQYLNAYAPISLSLWQSGTV
mmetsp:Transcript_29908/g.26457  ORF Transcript_29908/g.26457 Transcript_29908/m.26457 type:complete len:128 (-) Transcript_29908:252-635(-)